MSGEYRADQIKMSRPEWAWDLRIPRGAISLLVGYEGQGKSSFLCQLAAGWTRKEISGREERIHISMIEDDLASVVKPRLVVSKADLSLIEFRDEQWSFRSDNDIKEYTEYIFRKGINISILDPLDVIVPNLAGQSSGSMLRRLSRVCQTFNHTIVFAHHFNTTARRYVSAVGGGRGVTGAPRAVLIWGEEPPDPMARLMRGFGVADDEEEDDENIGTENQRCVLVFRKNSMGIRQQSEMYERTQKPHPIDASQSVPIYSFAGPCKYTAQDLIDAQYHAPVDSDPDSKSDRARLLILCALTPVSREGLPTELLARMMSLAGISDITYRRTRADMAKEGEIERHQIKDGNGKVVEHRWRLAVPDAPPKDWDKK